MTSTTRTGISRRGVLAMAVATTCFSAAARVANAQGHTVTLTARATVPALASVRAASPLVEDESGDEPVLTGTVTTAATATFSLEVRVQRPAAAIVAVRVTGGPWIAVEPGTWVQVTDRPPGAHVVAVEFLIQPSPDDPTPPPAPTWRAVVR